VYCRERLFLRQEQVIREKRQKRRESGYVFSRDERSVFEEVQRRMRGLGRRLGMKWLEAWLGLLSR
jgi:hypothetical protein